MTMKLIFLICYNIQFLKFLKGEESFCVLNGKKSLNYVSDKFISFSVDPTVLFTDLNISETSHELGKYLTPAYVRVAGPSTKYLMFSENEEDYQADISSSKLFVYTPSFMDSLNEWFINTNLSMIFAFNECDKVDGKWKSMNAFIESSAQINSNCSWQLGYKSDNLTFKGYQENVNILKNMLDTFPSKKNDWPIISNELNEWSQTSFDLRRNIDILQNVAKAVLWESELKEDMFFEKDEMTKLLSVTPKPALPVWVTIPKWKMPITFSSTLALAKQIGQAAISGYEVIFKQPRLYELMADTPNYWYILFHKNLMGRNVLDVKVNGIQKIYTYIYAHCTKNQNSFSRRGAITICVVNNGSYEHTTSLKVPTATANVKHIEVQSYVLTSNHENSTDIYCNNKRLTMELLRQNKIFIPKVRRARITKSLALTVLPKSIGFFILPDARIPICINDEDETNLIIEEIGEVQKTDVMENIDIKSRNTESYPSTLNDLYNEMKNELEVDRHFYQNESIVDSSIRSLDKDEIKQGYHSNDNLKDVTSQEIEEVVLKVTRNRNKRDINMKLLEQKAAKEETPFTKLKESQFKSPLKTEKLDINKDSSRKAKTIQEMLEDLLKPKPFDLSNIFHSRISEKLMKNMESNEEDVVVDDYLEDIDASFLDNLDTSSDKEFKNDFTVTDKRHDNEDNIKEREKSPLSNNMMRNAVKDLEDYFKVVRNQHSDKNGENYQLEELMQESILDNPENYMDYDEETPITRKKREQKQFTEDDVAHYRQLMTSNIRHMRDHIRKNKLKVKPTKNEQVNLAARINRLREAVEMVQKSGNKAIPFSHIDPVTKLPASKSKLPFDQFKVTLTNNAKLNTAQLLKSRLAQHKLNQNDNDNIDVIETENKNKLVGKKKDEIDDETKELIKKIKDELRNRKPRGLKVSQEQPERRIMIQEKATFQTKRGKINKSNKFKRSITKSKYDKYENTVNSINGIGKDAKYFIPKVATNSDFTLVLPTKDEISLTNTENASEIKLKYMLPKKKTKELLTSEVTYTESTVTHLGVNVTKDLAELHHTASQKHRDTEIVSLRSQTPFDKLFDSAVELIGKLREKIKSYLKYLDE